MSADADYADELHAEREELLAEYESVNSCLSLLEFQLRLAAAIELREPFAFKLRNRDAREHLRLLRLLGDGLAWRYLHSYAIRQLAKNPAPPPALGGQGDGFRETIAAAGELAARACVVLISDLTHCLTIGDLVICNDREHPSIVECGGHDALLHKGRKGRQMRRAQAVIDLLTEGAATLLGDSLPTQTLELTTPSVATWATVDGVVQAADREGLAWEFAAAHDLVFAVAGDEDLSAIESVLDRADKMTQPSVAAYTRLLDRPDPRVPPCTAWDVSRESRRLVYQGDVSVCHVIDLEAFVGRQKSGAEIVKVLNSGKEVQGFGVTVGSDQLSFSHEFLTDVLLGFSIVESTANAMLEAALATSDLLRRGSHLADSSAVARVVDHG